MLTAQPTDAELALFALWNGQIDFPQFMFGEELKALGTGYIYYYQYLWLMAEELVNASGRNLGKSFLFEKRAVHRALLRPRKKTVITALDFLHLKPRMDAIITHFNKHPILKYFLEKSTQTPFYSLLLTNGHEQYGVIAGTDGGQNLLQFHVHEICIDEAQMYPAAARQKMPGMMLEGCTFYECGVPDGDRTSPFYADDNTDSRFADKRSKVPSYMNSLWDDPKVREAALVTYGGKDTNLYKQNVLGQWGEPVEGVWSYQDLTTCVNKHRLPHLVEITKDRVDLILANLTPEWYHTWPQYITVPPVPEEAEAVIVAMDVGQSVQGDPSIIYPFSLVKGRWVVPYTIEVKGVIAKLQAPLLYRVAKLAWDRVKGIGVDATGAEGKAVIDELRTETGRYDADIKKLLEPVVFSSTVVTEFVKKFNERKGAEEVQEVKQAVKDFTTVHLRAMFFNRQIELPNDDRLIAEFTGEKQKMGQRGIIYNPDNRPDHCIAAFRCFALVEFLRIKGGPRLPVEKVQVYEMPAPQWFTWREG